MADSTSSGYAAASCRAILIPSIKARFVAASLSMRIAFRIFFLLVFPLLASASQDVSCTLEQRGDEAVMLVPGEADALGGAWKEMGKFRVRTVFAASAARRPWLLVEVYAKAADGDYRIISSQKVFAPFATGHMEVVEPGLGRSLRYECKETQ